MKTFIQISKVFFLSLVLANCSSSDDADPVAPVILPPSVTTVSAGNIDGLSVTLNGDITFAGTIGVSSYGFAIGTQTNPTIENDYTISNYINHTGAFTETVSLYAPNTLYHVRAYVTFIAADGFSTQTIYGNDISFTTSYPIQGMPVKDIITNQALFRMNVLSIPPNVYEMGVCYGTLSNPTVTNGNVVQFAQATGYQEYVNNNSMYPLTPNTIYYVRPYYKLNDNMAFYGEQTSFRTTGYFGPANGYVAYDKGEMSDGWRYLEVSPTTLLYSGSSPEWGCFNTFIANTFPETGTGLSNTNTVAAGCTSANSAARMCYNLVRNGQSDWFLGSRDEMLTVVRSLKAINVNLQDCWTSTETTASQAYYITTHTNGELIYATVPKYYGYNVFPIRRY